MFSFVGCLFEFYGLVIYVPTSFEGLFELGYRGLARIESVLESFTHLI